MKTVTLYSTGTCPWCVQAENLLNRIGAPVEKIRVDQSAEQRDTMIARSGQRTVPMYRVMGASSPTFRYLTCVPCDISIQNSTRPSP